jgi:hypothetical protein
MVCKVTEIIKMFQKLPLQVEKVNLLLLIAQKVKHGPAAHERMLQILQLDWKTQKYIAFGFKIEIKISPIHIHK